MKKLSLLLALIMLLTGATAFAAEIDPSALEPYEIVWYTVGGESDSDESVLAAINAYLTENYNCTIKFVKGTYNETIEKLQYLTSGQAEFDLILVASEYANYVAKEAFYPLSDLIQEYGQNILKNWPEALWQAVTIDGEFYAVPTHKYSCSHYYFAISMDQAAAVGVEPTFLQDDTLDKMGKWHAFMDFCYEMKEAGAGANGFVTNLNNSIFQALYPYEALTGNGKDPGVCIIGDDSFPGVDHNVVINQYDTEEFMQYCRDAYALAQAGCLPLDPSTSAKMANNDPIVPIQDSMAKRLAGYSKTYQQEYQPYFVNYAFQTTDKIYGSMNAISATSKDPARVMMFLNAICGDVEFANLVAYGLEGQDWFRNDNGQIEKIGSTGWNLYNAYYPGFIIAEPDTSLPANMVELYENFATTLVPSDNVGFAFNEEPILTELAAIRQVTAEYVDPLCKGLSDPEENVPKFLEALKNAGVDTVIAELQNQVDAWRAGMGL